MSYDDVKPRKYTNAVIDACEEGALDWETVARECLSYMSESDVEDMATGADFVEDLDEDDEEEEDDEETDCFEVDDDFEEAFENGEEPRSCRICAYWNDVTGECLIGRTPQDED